MPSPLQIFNQWQHYDGHQPSPCAQCFLCAHTSPFEFIKSAIGSETKAPFPSRVKQGRQSELRPTPDRREPALPLARGEVRTPGGGPPGRAAGTCDARPLVEGPGF